ncbi:MAG: hypothetical protein RLN69_00720 [Woeseiaceae bacterium]
MKNNSFTDAATEVQLALSEIYPDSTYGAIPVAEQHDALMNYRAADEDVLAEFPQAFAAYLDYQRNQWG